MVDRGPGESGGPESGGPEWIDPATVEPTEDLPFEPTGLDLARRIAAAAGRSVPAQPRADRPRKKIGARRPASRRDGKAEPLALGEALEDVIEQRGWGAHVSVHLLLGRWPELVGEVIAEHSTPEAYRDRVLVVRTSSTNWAAQLRLMAPQLLAKMNGSLGDGTIRRVQVIGPQAPSWKHGPRSVKGRGPRDTYG